MLIKGGILLAIRYQGLRYTRDIDFSTSTRYEDFDEERFLAEFSSGLLTTSAQLEYDLDCRLQSRHIQPANRPDASFPTLKLTIGYAPKQEPRRHKRLLAGQAIDVIEVDYSFNEETLEVENILLTDGGEFHAYSFADVVAEKYRAMLQQEIRNRVRRQDAYDLYVLLEQFPHIPLDEKAKILSSLRRKSESRGLEVNSGSMANEAIVERSKKEYEILQSEITDESPPFERVYPAVKAFYELLPW
ncbi:MAG: nucleotidyl transferase AbiEii/AbiGii toxin family protein [Gammaproteobacteria bacterium]|nr:nucleotidyl transferase AbiEii/AbiGii toxin family protein [Gammaproteobacteria bacterium]